jgi:hypothetical protein
MTHPFQRRRDDNRYSLSKGDGVMSAKTKTYDCVEAKNRIQAELLAEKKRLGEAEMTRLRREWLETSTDPLAVWWRAVG